MSFGEFFVRMFGWAIQEMVFWLTIITGSGFVALGAILIGLALCRR